MGGRKYTKVIQGSVIFYQVEPDPPKNEIKMSKKILLSTTLLTKKNAEL